MKKIYFTTMGFSRSAYLLSFLELNAGDNKFMAAEINQSNAHQIENCEDCYIMHSMMEAGDFSALVSIIDILKKNYTTLKMKILIGGTLVSFLDLDDVKKYYPEITHICLDKGEYVTKEIIFNNAPNGVYDGRNFPQVTQYPLTRNFWKYNKRQFLITMDDSRCRWKKCTFCHHYNNSYNDRAKTTPDMAVDLFIEQMSWIKGTPSWQFYDNDLNLFKLYEFFRILKEKEFDRKVNISLFGVRPDSRRRFIKQIIDEYGYNPIESISLGTEIVHDEALKLYNKNTTVKKIIEATEFYSYDLIETNTNHNLLIGLPLLGNKHYDATYEFTQKYGSTKDLTYFYPNFFRLNDTMDMFKNADYWKMKIHEPYTIQEFVSADNNLAPIKTNYYKFDTYDIDTRKWLNRQQVREKYNQFLNLEGVDVVGILK